MRTRRAARAELSRGFALALHALTASCGGCLSGGVDFVAPDHGTCPPSFPVQCADRHCYRTAPSGCFDDGGPGGGLGGGGQAGGATGGGAGGSSCEICNKNRCGPHGQCDCGACMAGDVCNAGECEPDLDFSTVDDAGGRWEWENPLPQGNALRAVWGAPDSGHVWAVGDHGTVLRFDGTIWSRVRSGITHHLRAIHGRGPANIWAVGDHGAALHFDGRQWSRQFALPAHLRAVWVGEDTIHLLGESRADGGGGIAFEGVKVGQISGWAQRTLAGTQIPWAIHEFEGQLIAVGGGRNAAGAWFLVPDAGWQELRFDLQPLTAGDFASGLNVLVPHRGTLWAIGRDARPLQLRDGGLSPLSELTRNSYKLPGVGGNGTVSAATTDLSGSLIFGSGTHAVLRYEADGGATRLGDCFDTTACFFGQDVQGLHRASDGTVISVGQGGRIYRSLTDAGWRRDGSGLVFEVRALAALVDGGVIAVGGSEGGDEGHELTRVGAAWQASAREPSTAWRAVACNANGLVLTAGIRGRYRLAPMPTQICNACGDFNAVRSFGATGFLAVAKDGGYRIRVDGGEEPVTGLIGDVTGLTVDAPARAIDLASQVYEPGDGGFVPVLFVAAGRSWPWVITQNSSEWLAAGQGIWRKPNIGPPQPVRPPTTRYLGVFTDALDTHWAVGEDGLTTRCTSSRCVDQNPPTQHTLFGVGGTPALGPWVTGSDGTILRFVP